MIPFVESIDIMMTWQDRVTFATVYASWTREALLSESEQLLAVSISPSLPSNGGAVDTAVVMAKLDVISKYLLLEPWPPVSSQRLSFVMGMISKDSYASTLGSGFDHSRIPAAF